VGTVENTMTARLSTIGGKIILNILIKKHSWCKGKGCGRRNKAHLAKKNVWEQVASWLNNPDKIAAALQQEKIIHLKPLK
jgi:site-specific DNA recombinase